MTPGAPGWLELALAGVSLLALVEVIATPVRADRFTQDGRAARALQREAGDAAPLEVRALTPDDATALRGVPLKGVRLVGVYAPGDSGAVLTRSASPSRWLAKGVTPGEPMTLGEGWSLLQVGSDGRGPTLRRAQVETRTLKGGARKPCRRTAPERFQCDRASWAYVGPTTKKIQGAKQKCYWVHPLPGRATHIRIPNVSGAQRVSFALADAAVRGSGKPVKIVVQHGAHQRAHTHRDVRGWRHVALPAPPKAAPLEIIVDGTHTGRRHLCMKLSTGGAR